MEYDIFNMLGQWKEPIIVLFEIQTATYFAKSVLYLVFTQPNTENYMRDNSISPDSKRGREVLGRLEAKMKASLWPFPLDFIMLKCYMNKTREEESNNDKTNQEIDQ